MARFADERAEGAYRDGSAPGVPAHVARRAQWIIHLLLAVDELTDARFIAPVARWDSRPGWYGLALAGKWYVMFQWEAGVGAMEIGLERR